MADLFISKQIFNGFLQFVHGRGIDITTHINQELQAQINGENTSLIPYSDYAKLYDFAVYKSGDTLLGLHEGEQYNLAALGIIGQMIQVSRTMHEALEKTFAGFNLISNVIQLEPTINGNRFRLTFNCNSDAVQQYPVTTKHLLMASMVFSYKEIHFLTLTHPVSLKVGLDFKSSDTSEFERIFNVMPRLESDGNFLEMEADILDKKIVYSDYELLSILENIACRRLENISQSGNNLENRIRQLIYALLDPGIPDIDTIAKNLNLSARSLQRKLNSKGTSYSKIIESVKKDLATEYLKRDLTIQEVSDMMGYSESSAFVSAFKKWFGETPAKFKLLL